MVGRMTEAQGNVLRYLAEQDDWVAVIKDTPVRAEDALYSDEGGKAEFALPNNTLARVGSDTEFQLTKLGEDLTEVDVGAGVARLVNKSPSTIVKATTPFGYVLGPPRSSFDLYVGKDSVEVISVKDKVFFVPLSEAAKYEVIAGESSILADGQQTGLGSGSTDAAWNDWNVERDKLWENRLQVKGDSIQYLPEELKSDSYELDENGRWEKVYYDKCKCETWVWRPTRVRGDWTPFTEGRWTEWNGDQCWVPDEPFGYVTHHYGNWILVGGGWYWAPPVVHAAVGVTPIVSVGLNWYPGRVAWFSSDVEIGWVPLAPYEPYYSVAYWGPASLVVATLPVVNIDIGGYAYWGHSVVVNQQNFYSVNNYYSTTNIRNVNVTRVTNYRASAVVHKRMFRDGSVLNKKHDFTNRQVSRKPDRAIGDRVRNVNANARQTRDLNGRSVVGKAAKVPRNAEPLKKAELPSPGRTPRRSVASTQPEVPGQHPRIDNPRRSTDEQAERPGRSHRPTAEQADRALKSTGENGSERVPAGGVKSPRAENAEQFKPGAQPAREHAGAPERGKAASSEHDAKPDKPGRKQDAREQQSARGQQPDGPQDQSRDKQAGHSARSGKGRRDQGAATVSGRPAQGRDKGAESVGRAQREKRTQTARPQQQQQQQQQRQQQQQQQQQRQQQQQQMQQRQQQVQQQQQQRQQQMQQRQQVQQQRPQPQAKPKQQPKAQQQPEDKKKKR
jgi:hypothetical protein